MFELMVRALFRSWWLPAAVAGLLVYAAMHRRQLEVWQSRCYNCCQGALKAMGFYEPAPFASSKWEGRASSYLIPRMGDFKGTTEGSECTDEADVEMEPLLSHTEEEDSAFAEGEEEGYIILAHFN